MNHYNGFDESNCGSQFDDNSCKRYPPKEYGCHNRDRNCYCTNCPPGPAAALTITPVAGGTRAVSAHLVITQLQ